MKLTLNSKVLRIPLREIKFYLPRDSAKTWPKMSNLQFSPFIVLKVRVFDVLNSRVLICLFEMLKIFYPPKGVCESRPHEVHLAVFSCFFVAYVGKGFLMI